MTIEKRVEHGVEVTWTDGTVEYWNSGDDKGLAEYRAMNLDGQRGKRSMIKSAYSVKRTVTIETSEWEYDT